MARSTSDIIGSLLTRPTGGDSKSKFGIQPSATRRRIQKIREQPVSMLKDDINEREAAESLIFSSGGWSLGDRAQTGAGGAGGLDAPGEMSEAEFNRRLQKMQAEAPGTISITSGKRDPEKQKKLWADALKKYGDPEIADNWVARPGTSKHESGLAADVRFENDAVKKWYHENAKKYGLYFPMGHEPWHIQFDTAYKGSQQQSPGRLPTGGSFTGDPNLDFIIKAESGWKTDAQNPTSSAFGLGQLIKANREAYGKRFGYDPGTTDPMQQLHMMREYIKDRYGSTEAAAAFKRKHGWY